MNILIDLVAPNRSVPVHGNQQTLGKWLEL